MITAWEDRFTAGVVKLWNKQAVRDGYKSLTEDDFTALFLLSPYFDREAAFVLVDQDQEWDQQEQKREHVQVLGFACGCTGDDLPLGERAGYITCIILAESVQTDESYRMMIGAIERRFQQRGKQRADFLFFNPMKLPWLIPGTDEHEHNNAPGVPEGSRLHEFLLRYGYVERALECGMYLPLGAFSIPEEIRGKESKAAAEGYRVELFDSVKHSGLEQMLAGLDNPLWQEQIPRYAADGVPVMIAAYQGKAAGFAGPIIREPSGRAFFIGIGVHPQHEGHGLGSILFFKMCEAFQQAGAEYISLFTGSENPAKRIYERAGFQTVKRFAIMRREF